MANVPSGLGFSWPNESDSVQRAPGKRSSTRTSGRQICLAFPRYQGMLLASGGIFMKFRRYFIGLIVVFSVLSTAQQFQETTPSQESKKIPAGSTIYVAPMEGGFETYVVAGIMKKQVPVTVVNDRSKADFEMTGISDTDKAGWAKMLFLGSQQSNEQASIKVTDLKSGVVVYGYSVHKTNSYKGKQSAGEACAKHLKEKIENK